MIILDTHIWLWWVNGDTEKLSQRRLEQIKTADIVAVLAISSFEVAWLVHHGRIILPLRLSLGLIKFLKVRAYI
jgi:PIN domain nuclease of toxin-antitoxin system